MFEFQTVKLNNESSIVLFDQNREVFVELNENDSNYGTTEDNLRHLYNGHWAPNDFADRLKGLFTSNSETEKQNQNNLSPSNLTWLANNDYNLFENISDDKWIEKLDGIPTFEFQTIKLSDNNSVLLYDPKREVFVQLNEHDSNYGSSEDTLRSLYEGRWLNSDFSDRLVNRFGQKNQDSDENNGKLN